MICAKCLTKTQATSKFCPECGGSEFADDSEYDQLPNIKKYVSDLLELAPQIGYSNNSSHLIQFQNHLAALKISRKLQEKLVEKFVVPPPIGIYFDRNSSKDSVVGGDSLFRFNIRNLSQEPIKSVQLTWRDQDSDDGQEISMTSRPIVAGESGVIEQSHIFSRAGVKAITLDVCVSFYSGEKHRYLATGLKYILKDKASSPQAIHYTQNITARIASEVAIGNLDGHSTNHERYDQPDWEELKLTRQISNDDLNLDDLGLKVQALIAWPWGIEEIKSPMLIGREPPASQELISRLEAEYLYVSKRHAEIFWDQGMLYVKDLGSRNGTFIKDESIPPHCATPLKNGDVVRFSPDLAATIELVAKHIDKNN